MTSLTTPSQASDHDCKKATILNIGTEASCNGALIGIQQLQKAVLCAKETVPTLKVRIKVCEALRDKEKEFFVKRLEIMTFENGILQDQIRKKGGADLLDRFLWGASGVTLGAAIAIILLL